jgi:hypothetical protein
LNGPLKDSGFFYDRLEFKEKICFEENDLNAFICKKSIKYDIKLSRFIDNKVKEVTTGYLMLDLTDKVPNSQYTLMELIDVTVHVTKYKYA